MDNPNSFGSNVRRSGRRSGIWKALGVVVTAAAFLVMSVLPAWAADVMTVTFIRHGDSEGNASGLIDTSTPGPSLTPLGQQQAQAIANQLSVNNYDGIFASTMVRTQQTAAPMSQALGLPVTVLDGLEEIQAGIYEGTPEANATSGYLQAPIQWVEGNLSAQIPGSITGTQFEDRFNGAMQTIYNTGDLNPVVFSHGGAIMFWVMMNITNLTLQQKFALFASAPLSNTNYVVVQGSPTAGWTLLNWNGQLFGTQPAPAATIAVNNHTLQGQLAGVVQSIQAAFATHNIVKVLSAISSGVSTAAFSVQKYLRAIAPAIQQQVSATVAQVKTNVTNAVNQLKTDVTNVVNRFKPASTTTGSAVSAATPATPKTVSAVSAAATAPSAGQKPAAKPVTAAAANPTSTVSGYAAAKSAASSGNSSPKKAASNGNTKKAHAAAA
ncbi:broad specificity phosphatase PhoE/DNA-binding FrmR family transcriptional regulator [Mycobacterium sp. MAA66]|uniref:histidine phosphatase family protein n=1 Tax=Mycobacterium sp. MAA66 TaxID=3156297 RepID=UPI003515EFD9